MAKVTIKDIARESNVSIGTVYRAVYNSGRINKKTRERVLETVNRLGYKANSIARGLALHSKFNILVIMPSSPESFWGDVTKGTRHASAELSEFGVQIIEFFHDKDGKYRGQNVMDILTAVNVDAIAMCIVLFDDCGRVLLYAKEKNIPVAIFNDDTVSRDRLFFYGPDNFRAGQMAAELMNKCGGQNGTCCTVSSTTFSSSNSAGINRETGFKNYMEQNCSDMRFLRTYRCSLGETPLVIDQIIKDHPDITGFYFTDFTQMHHYIKLFADMKKRYIIIGHEYSDDYKDALLDGSITAILSEARICQGYYPLKILYQYLISGEKPRDFYYSNVNIIIGANVDCLNYSNNGCGFE